jgi:hypothetical protein
MRVYILYIVVFGLAVYAWRNWFVAACGLILLTGVSGHPDFPKYILGIQGLNPWNVLLAVVVLAWLVRRRDEGARFDLDWGPLGRASGAIWRWGR